MRNFSRNLHGTMKTKRNYDVRWISFERVFHRSFAVGVFVGWDNRLAVVGLQIGFWIFDRTQEVIYEPGDVAPSGFTATLG